MWSARRLSITTTTTFIAPTGACRRRKAAAPLGWSSSQAAAPRTARPAAPAPPARIRSRRVRSPATISLPSAPGYVDAPDGVLVRQLAEDLADDLLDIALVVAEVVEEGFQRSPGDLELRRREVQAIGHVVGTDQVELFICHAARTVHAAPGCAAGRPARPAVAFGAWPRRGC